MALTDENNGGIPATMLVSPSNMAGGAYPYPVYQNGGGNNGGLGDGQGWIVLILIILLAAGGWGNNAQNGNGFGGGQPIIVNDGGGNVQRGFDQAAVMNGVGAIQTGVQNLSTQLCGCCGDMQTALSNGFAAVQQSLCNGFAGVNSNIASGFAQAEIAANNRQMANMNQAFGMQTAMMQGFNQLGSQFADCCCENRLTNCQTQNIIQNEGNATRFADANNTRDIITNQTASTQAILDKLCQLELDGIKGQLAQAQRENVGLQNQLNMAAMRESQTAQNAFISQGFASEVDALYNRLSSCPVPTTPVYGRTPIFTCNNNNGCGCGCGGNNF